MEEERSVINEFEELYEHRDQLREQRDEASDLTRDLYDSAIETADNRLSELAQTPEAQEELEQLRRSIGATALEAFKEINELESWAGQLISPDKIQQRRQEVEKSLAENPEYRRMKQLQEFAGSAATGSLIEKETAQPEPKTETAVQSKPAAPVSAETDAPDQQQESEPAKPHVTVTVREDGNVQIGRRVVETGRYREYTHDYSEDRIKIMRTLIEHQSEELSVYDLWEKTFGDEGRPFEKDTMTHVKTWLQNHFTYNKKPIAVHNGRRGTQSAYTIKDFDVEFHDQHQTEGRYVLPNGTEMKGNKADIARALMENLENSEYMSSDALKFIVYGDTTHRSTQRLSACMSQLRRRLHRQGYRLSTIHEGEHSNSRAYYRIDLMADPEEPTEAETPTADSEYTGEHAEILQKINLPAATKLAACLEKRRDYLAQLGVQLPPEGMASAFLDYAETHGENLHQQESDMDTLRQQALEALAYIGENDDILEEALDVLPHNHPTLHLIEYIVDSADRIEDMQNVVKAKIRQEHIEQRGKRIEIEYKHSELVLPDGRIVKPNNPEAGNDTPVVRNDESFHGETDEESPDEEEMEPETTHFFQEVVAGPETESAAEEQASTVESPTKKQERESMLEQGIQDTIEETLKTIHQSGMLEGGTLPQVQSVYSFVTTRFLKSALENNIIKGNAKDKKFSAEEIIILKLLNEYGFNTYAIKQFQGLLKSNLRGAAERFKERYGIE